MFSDNLRFLLTSFFCVSSIFLCFLWFEPFGWRTVMFWNVQSREFEIAIQDWVQKKCSFLVAKDSWGSSVVCPFWFLWWRKLRFCIWFCWFSFCILFAGILPENLTFLWLFLSFQSFPVCKLLDEKLPTETFWAQIHFSVDLCCVMHWLSFQLNISLCHSCYLQQVRWEFFVVHWRIICERWLVWIKFWAFLRTF